MSIVALLLATDAHASRIVVNEFYRSGTWGSTGDEWIELVLLEDLTAAELEGFHVGDSSSSTEAKFSGYRLQNAIDFADVFPAGTILVLTGGAGAVADLTFDPANGDWNLVIPTTDPHVVGNGSSADFASTDVAYVDLVGTNGDQTLSADGFAVNWDSSPGVFGSLASVTLAPPNNTSGVQLTGDLAAATDPAAWLVSVALASLTPGQPNGGANTAAIDLLRAPACADTDLDGVCDDADGCPLDAPPDDDDGDLVCDSDDVCPTGDDAADFDGDGIPDACDVPLALTTGTIVAGSPFRVTATGANVGERVYFYGSPGGVGVGPCPASYGGMCFDLGAPASLLGSAIADANGRAQRFVTLPFNVPAGTTVTIQGAVKRGVNGADSDKTNPVEQVVQ